jgi:hypothetical protein
LREMHSCLLIGLPFLNKKKCALGKRSKRPRNVPMRSSNSNKRMKSKYSRRWTNYVLIRWFKKKTRTRSIKCASNARLKDRKYKKPFTSQKKKRSSSSVLFRYKINRERMFSSVKQRKTLRQRNSW